MVTRAIKDDGDRTGTNVPTILKYLESVYKMDTKDKHVRAFVAVALKRGVTANEFTHSGNRYKLKALSTKKPKASTPKRKTAKSPKIKFALSAPTEKAPSAIEDMESPKTTPKKKRKSIELKPSPTSTPLKKTPRKTPSKSPESSPKKSAVKLAKKATVIDTEEKEIEDVGNIAPDVTTTGVVFNTTDLSEVRLDVKTIIDALLTDDQVKVGVVANRGWKDTKYNLELLDFSDDSKILDEFVANSYGEGSQWLEYYREVLQQALNLSWANHKTKVLVLIGNEGIGAVSGVGLQAEVGRLSTLGVKVFAFHHSQLDLLKTVLKDLN